MSERDFVEDEGDLEGDETKRNESHFKSRFGNVLRRSKRMMSGRKHKDKENISPDKNALPDNSTDSTDSGGRKVSQTYFSQEKQVLIDGKKTKQVEVTGEKTVEVADMKKNKKLARKKSVDAMQLNVPCLDLGKADLEGWLLKKAGGHGLVPVSWKRYWCVVKNGVLHCYKTSFDRSADYLFNIKLYTIELATEKKKTCFRMKPNDDDHKLVAFSAETEAEINKWIEVLNLVITGVDISQDNDNSIPDYEERKRVYSNVSGQTKDDTRIKRPVSSAFTTNTETTGMPAGFGARTSSLSQPRVRKSSTNSKPESCLAVGSMFQPLQQDVDTPTKDDVNINKLFYKEVEVEVEQQEEEGTPVKDTKKANLEMLNAEIAKLNSDMLVLNAEGKRKEQQTIHEIPRVVVNDPPKDVFAENSVETTVNNEVRTDSAIFQNLESLNDENDIVAMEEKHKENELSKIDETTGANESVENPIEITSVECTHEKEKMVQSPQELHADIAESNDSSVVVVGVPPETSDHKTEVCSSEAIQDAEVPESTSVTSEEEHHEIPTIVEDIEDQNQQDSGESPEENNEKDSEPEIVDEKCTVSVTVGTTEEIRQETSPSADDTVEPDQSVQVDGVTKDEKNTSGLCEVSHACEDMRVTGKEETTTEIENGAAIQKSDAQPAEQNEVSDVEVNDESEVDIKSETVNADIKSEPINGHTTSEPINGDTTSEPINGDTTSEPINGDTTSEPINGDTTSEPINGDTTSEPINGDIKSEAINGDTTSEPINGDTTSEPINGDTTSEPINGDTTSEPINGDIKSEAINGDTTSEPINGDTTSEPINGDTTSEPINGDIKIEPINGDTTSEPINVDIKIEPINGDTTSEPINGDIKSEPINGNTKSEPINDGVKETSDSKDDADEMICDLGEDLDIPVLSSSDTSFSEAVSLELNAPKTESNGHANHVMMV